MFLKKFGSAVAAIALSFGGTAIAQTSNNNFYIQVGSNHRGEPIILDLSSVKGTEYTVLHQDGSNATKTTFRASCSQSRLFSVRVSLYASTGKLTRDDQTKREIFPKPGTPEANSMEIVCRGAEAGNVK